MNNVVGFNRRPSSMEGPRASFADVVPGARLFIVGASFNDTKTKISEVEIRGVPRDNGTGIWFVAHTGVRPDGKCGKIETQMSLRDAGIIPNKYNMCRTFTSREDAELYRARFDRHELTHFEHRRYEQIMRKRIKQFGM